MVSNLHNKIDLLYNGEKYTVDKGTIHRNKLHAILYKTIYKEKYGKYNLSAKRDIDLRTAPLCPNGISWNDCIGLKFPFHFDDIISEVKILNFNPKLRTLTIYIEGYTSEEGYTIHASDLAKCKLYNCLFVKSNTVKNNRPDLIKYLVNPEDAELCVYSNKIIECICPICGTIKRTTMNDLSSNGIRCQKCRDHISYPEKFIMDMLNQLNIFYIYQLNKTTFDWCEHIYDFYVPSYNCIIETHGMQHYNGGFQNLGGRTKEEEQENDKIKELKARNNGITHYITLNCSESNITYIKNSVIRSELPNLFNFTIESINWNQCGENAASNYMKKYVIIIIPKPLL